MADITMTEVRDIADPKLKGIAERVLNTLKVEVERAYASQIDTSITLPKDETATEHLLVQHLKAFQPEKQKQMSQKALQTAKLPEEKRIALYGDAGKAKLQGVDSIDVQVKKLGLPESLRISPEHMTNLRNNLHTSFINTRPVLGPVLSGPGLFRPQQRDELEFRVLSIRCVDETDPEWLGDDEMAIGGIGINPATNQVIRIGEYDLGGGYHDGVVRNYSPPLQFLRPPFNLQDGANRWPKNYTMTLFLAEKDFGGFGQFITEAWQKVRAKVLGWIETLGNDILSGLGDLIGWVVGWIVDNFLKILVDWFNDDIFPSKTVSITIPSLAHTWPDGRPDSPDQVLQFVGHGGTYQVNYDWRRTFATPPLQPRRLTGSVLMYAMDHENFGRNETGNSQHPVNVRLEAIGRDYPVTVPHLRVGGEVRLELHIKASIRDVSGAIAIQGELRLYEGDSDNSNDLDGVRQINLVIPANSSQNAVVDIRNDNEGGDTGQVTLRFNNQLG